MVHTRPAGLDADELDLPVAGGVGHSKASGGNAQVLHVDSGPHTTGVHLRRSEINQLVDQDVDRAQ